MRLMFICFVLVSMCIEGSWSDQETYKVAILHNANNTNLVPRYKTLVNEVKYLKLDMFLLPSSPNDWSQNEENTYDKSIETISKLAKNAKIYIVSELQERVKCDNQYEVFKNSVVFDRNGNIVSVLKNPVNINSKCNTTQKTQKELTTDFGVTFSHVNIKDLLLKHPSEFTYAKDYLLSGTWVSELPFMTTSQLQTSYSTTNGVNLVGATGVYNGKSTRVVHIDSFTRIVVVELKKGGGVEKESHMVEYSPGANTFENEDLSQYIIRPVDLDASANGLEETVCHGEFCCEFYLKTSFGRSKPVEPYSLVVFDGLKIIGSSNVGFQICGVVACDGVEDSCVVIFKNKTNQVIFEEINIRGNFSENSIQYPTTFNQYKQPLSYNQYSFGSTDSHVTLSLKGSNKLISFGIYGRDFENDSKSIESDYKSNQESDYNNVYDFIFEGFFDYVWIRLCFMIFIVSIYVLEMI